MLATLALIFAIHPAASGSCNIPRTGGGGDPIAPPGSPVCVVLDPIDEVYQDIIAYLDRVLEF